MSSIALVLGLMWAAAGFVGHDAFLAFLGVFALLVAFSDWLIAGVRKNRRASYELESYGRERVSYEEAERVA